MTTDNHDSRPEPLLYPVSEAARMLGIGRTNLYKLMDEGQITSVRIGHRRLVPRSAIDEFIAGLLGAA